MPLKKTKLPGGILADEMGLGKTLEILTCIMINRRQEIPAPVPYENIPGLKKKFNKNKLFSCLCGNAPRDFETMCCDDSDDDDDYVANRKEQTPKQKQNSIMQCVVCGVWTHVDCVNYQGIFQNN